MMRFIYSILFLNIILTSSCFAEDYTGDGKIIVTADFCKNIFDKNLITGYSVKNSIPYALRYINSHRNAYGKENVILKNIGKNYDPVIKFFGDTVLSQVTDYMNYDTCTIVTLKGKTFGFIDLCGSFKDNLKIIEEFRAEHTADFMIGMFDTEEDHRTSRYGLDLYLYKSDLGDSEFFVVDYKADSLSVKKVDYSRYDPEERFIQDLNFLCHLIEERLESEYVILTDSIDTGGSFFGPSYISSIFHKFQTETTGADLSVYAPVRYLQFPSGRRNLRDMFILTGILNDPEMTLLTIRLSGSELLKFMESTCGNWFNDRRYTEYELLKIYRTAGEAVYPSAYRKNYSVSGMEYTIDVSKNTGSKIRINRDQRLDDKTIYTVAVIAHRWNSYGNEILVQAGVKIAESENRIISKIEYIPEFLRWAAKREILDIPVDNNWNIIPEKRVDKSLSREGEIIFR
ncbi:MAG: 5'-nucleotidase C-terminal domain-containing protein [Rikenellaceae bacterium]|nr:5'-nucleotidase C-terminal domain-containing protein [Rikenellaceae bacterium]